MREDLKGELDIQIQASIEEIMEKGFKVKGYLRVIYGKFKNSRIGQGNSL